MKQDMKQSTAKIPEGYKNTLLGIIPNEWEVKKIKEIGQVVTGNTPATSEKENYGDSYLFVSPVDLSDLKYIKNTEKKLSLIGFEKSRKLPKGAVLFTCIGLIGKVGISLCDLSCNQQINAIICNELMFNEYLYYELRIRASKIKLIAGEQVLPIINKSDFENVKILIPPLPEQRKIAEVLSTWDKAIEKQTLLVEKLELRKKGLMQQLLTGKKRLPGFSEEWKKVKLGDIAKRIVRKNNIECSNVVTISAQKGFVRQTDFFNKKIASETVENYYLVKRDEFCYNKSYCNGFPMGAIKRLKEFDQAVVTTLYICFSIQPERASLDFIEQYFSLGLLNRGLMKIANEGGRAHGLLNVTPNDFFNTELMLPPFDEQKAISSILLNAHEEVIFAKSKLEFLRKEKKGLMQVLLIGKKRFK